MNRRGGAERGGALGRRSAMVYEKIRAFRELEAREIAVAGALTTAAVFMVIGQEHLAAGTAALGFAALLAQKPDIGQEKSAPVPVLRGIVTPRFMP